MTVSSVTVTGTSTGPPSTAGEMKMAQEEVMTTLFTVPDFCADFKAESVLLMAGSINWFHCSAGSIVAFENGTGDAE